MIAEDNEDLRFTMVALIDAESDMRCVAETSELDRIAPLAASTDPQVVILDLDLKGQSSLSYLPRLAKDVPGARFLVYSGHALPALVDAALAAGATEYVLKSGDPYELIDAVRRCARA
jgi:two-component system response regulator DesR